MVENFLNGQRPVWHHFAVVRKSNAAWGRKVTGLAHGQFSVVNWQWTSPPPPALASTPRMVKYGGNITPSNEIGRKSKWYQTLLNKRSILGSHWVEKQILICENLRSSKSPGHMERSTVGAPHVLALLPLSLIRHQTPQTPWLPSSKLLSGTLRA